MSPSALSSPAPSPRHAGTLLTQRDEWTEGREKADGILGISAPHPTEPRNERQTKIFVEFFEGKEKYLILRFESLNGTKVVGNGKHLDTTNAKEHFENKFGFTATDVFVFDGDGELLTIEQLDYLAEKGFQPIFVNCRTWGDKGTSAAPS